MPSDFFITRFEYFSAFVWKAVYTAVLFAVNVGLLSQRGCEHHIDLSRHLIMSAFHLLRCLFFVNYLHSECFLLLDLLSIVPISLRHLVWNAFIFAQKFIHLLSLRCNKIWLFFKLLFEIFELISMRFFVIFNSWLQFWLLFIFSLNCCFLLLYQYTYGRQFYVQFVLLFLELKENVEHWFYTWFTGLAQLIYNFLSFTCASTQYYNFAWKFINILQHIVQRHCHLFLSDFVNVFHVRHRVESKVKPCNLATQIFCPGVNHHVLALVCL